MGAALAGGADGHGGGPALGVYQEASNYCGRVLMSVTVEERKVIKI